MATIRSIAEHANVSIATVSKVLNGKSGVREETRQMILNVAHELNYRPNLNARSLKSGRAQTIGIIAEDLTVFNTPKIIDGVAVACDEANYHYILANLRMFQRCGHHQAEEKVYTEMVRDAVNVLLARQVDGIIYIGSHSHVISYLPEYAVRKRLEEGTLVRVDVRDTGIEMYSFFLCSRDRWIDPAMQAFIDVVNRPLNP